MLFKPSFNTIGLSTFKTVHQCGAIYRVHSLDQLKMALCLSPDAYILGGGSNTLFVKDIERDIIIIELKGKYILRQDDQTVDVTFAAGEDWHEMVMWAIEHDFGGIENLSLIPGKCGAAPMQNIGAYGVEVKDVLLSVQALEKNTLDLVHIDREACQFGYRQSNFKSIWSNRFVITAITLRLTIKDHKIYDGYGAIKHQLETIGKEHPTIQDISRAVIAIRSSKLPDPKYLANAGSFFKNPIVSSEHCQKLMNSFPDMPVYPVDDSCLKIAAGWLIDRAGWRGRRVGDVGSHKDQALVIVNYDKATGQEVLDFAQTIQEDVLEKFGVLLEMEVNIVL